MHSTLKNRNEQLNTGCKRGLKVKIRVRTNVGVQLIINVIETGGLDGAYTGLGVLVG